MKTLQISITFLNGTYHGRVGDGRVEWPPSPMRVFQALIATAGRMHVETIPEQITQSLQWLSNLPAPEIRTPPHRRAQSVQSSVPNNAMDICARAWSRGSYDTKDAKPSTHKAMKTIAPVHLLVTEPLDTPVRYRWTVSDNEESVGYSRIISMLAGRLVCVGWGLDLVVGYAELINAHTSEDELNEDSVRWTKGRGSTPLRLPNEHSLLALQKRHKRFVNRLVGGSLASVPTIPASSFDMVNYGRDWEMQQMDVAAFSLIEVDGSNFVRFPTRKGTELVGMVRSVLASTARLAGWSEEKVASIVLGHGERYGEQHQSVGLKRFAYLPLPSLEPRVNGAPANHVGFIRRLLIYSPSGMLAEELDWVRRALAGAVLIDEKHQQSVAMLSTIPVSESVVRRYIGDVNRNRPSATWSTVTPMVLPRNYMRRQDVQRLKSASDVATKRELYDQRDQRIDKVIRLAISQAGYSDPLAQYADIDWRKVGYWPGAPANNRIFVPSHLRKFPTLHVRITWRDSAGNSIALPGPIAIGGGRFFGIGLFASESHNG